VAQLVIWFLSNHPDSICISTAPTYRQVKSLLWGEIRSAHKNAKFPLGGKMSDSGTEWRISDKWYALGFSPKKEITGGGGQGKASSFQGFHASYVMVVFDEATGIDAQVWTMAEGLQTSGVMVKFLAIGNPTTKNCAFFSCFQSAQWKKVHISCFDSPNFIANGIKNIDGLRDELVKLKGISSEEDRLKYINEYKKPVPYLLTCQWAIPYCLDLGLDRPLVKSKVLGDFPDDDESVIVQLADVELSQNREIEFTDADTRYIGVDVARYGNDLSIFTELIGNVETRVKSVSKMDVMVVTGGVVAFAKEEHYYHRTIILIDEIGIGAGVVDRLNELKRNKEIPITWCIYGINVGSACKDTGDKISFKNLKAYMYWNLRSWVKYKGKLLNDTVYAAELPTIKYFPESNGKIRIESKDDYKSRTGRGSPDYTDSLALAVHGQEYVPITIDPSQDELELEEKASEFSAPTW
jgi:hypothetical protein